MYGYVYVCIYVYIVYVYIYVCMYVCVYVYMFICVYICCEIIFLYKFVFFYSSNILSKVYFVYVLKNEKKYHLNKVFYT